MRRVLLTLVVAGTALLPSLALAQNGVVNPLTPSGNPFNPVVPHGNNNGNGPSMQDIMRLRMMQQMMGSRRNQPQYGAGGMRQPMINGQYQNPIMAPFAAPEAPAVDPAKVARDAEKARARQRADEIRSKDAAARERRKNKLLEEKAAREGQAPDRPQPQPSEKAEEEKGAEEKAADEKAEEKATEKPADKESEPKADKPDAGK